MNTPPQPTGAIELTADGVSFQLSTAGRTLSVTISPAALAALEEDENVAPIDTFWHNALVIVGTAARMAEQNPTLEMIDLNRGHFY